MYNFQFNFTHPWLLLLIIPAVVLTLIPYFRLSKRHRRTRNRITSIVLHIIVMVLAILALSGLTFSYQIPNDENQIILLVDVSDSEETAQQERDDFVELVLQDCQYDGYKVGIVTFGYDQEYAVPLTYELEDAYSNYLGAELPDTSATNIAAALNYAKDLFDNAQSAKIVLITDGKETDEEASLVIRSVAAQGIKVDVANIGAEYEGNDVQITGAELPEYHMVLEEEYEAKITLQSKVATNAVVEMLDNGELRLTQNLALIEGKQDFVMPITFTAEGLHEIMFRISVTSDDALLQNNIYYTYYNLEMFNEILILEGFEGESEKLVTLLNGEEDYEITVYPITAADRPTTLEQLCDYDQVILNNVSNTVLEIGAFDEVLKTYVEECGGGLFTVGGDRTEGDEKVANAYNRSEMYGSTYQELLPVDVINYTPPLGVMVLIDISGSMSSDTADGATKLDWAKAGIQTFLEEDVMSVRDYLGIMTFDDYQNTILELTPRTNEAKIREAINAINKESASGGTVSADAIERAGQALRAQKDIDKRHIILITDGGISGIEACIEKAEQLYLSDGITLSVVGIGVSDTYYESMQTLVNTAHGRLIIEEPGEDLINAMRDELYVSPLKEVADEKFNPIINDMNSPLVRDLTHLETGAGTDDKKLALTLDGFYGTKAKANADVILMGEYEVPIYAQWKYGNGMVGSFLCDLNGVRSADFMAAADGVTFIKNVVNNLMPTESIRPNEITISLKEDNYTNKLSIYTTLNEGETLTGTIYDSKDNAVADMNTQDVEGEGIDFTDLSHYVTASMNADNNYSRCDFVIKEGGVYKLVIVKYDAGGNELARLETYKRFSYSEEYDTFIETEEEALVAPTMLSELADKGYGAVIEDIENPWEIFKGFITDIDKNFDPRFLFMIIAIVLFLLDIIVRKFKFKWPHELVRDYKARKAEKEAQNPQ